MMTIFYDDGALADTPLPMTWTIAEGDRGAAIINGVRAFHEGRRVVSAEVLIIDPLLRWCLTLDGGYQLSALGIPARNYSEWPRRNGRGIEMYLLVKAQHRRCLRNTINDGGAVEAQSLDPPRTVRGLLMLRPAAHADVWRVVEHAAPWAAVEAEKS
jgi:hypothetical protein